MPIFETAVIAFTVVHSILKSIKSISEYYENRDKEIQKIVCLACEFTYATYIRKEKNGKLTDEQREKAMEITKKFFYNKSTYKISETKLRIYINERLLFIKQCKRNNDTGYGLRVSSNSLLSQRKNSNDSYNSNSSSQEKTLENSDDSTPENIYVSKTPTVKKIKKPKNDNDLHLHIHIHDDEKNKINNDISDDGSHKSYYISNTNSNIHADNDELFENDVCKNILNQIKSNIANNEIANDDIAIANNEIEGNKITNNEIMNNKIE